MQTKINKMFTLEECLFEKAVNISLGLRACGYHKLTSLKMVLNGLTLGEYPEL